MLGSLRAFSNHFITKLLLGLLILTFALWGVGDMLRHPGGNAVATVGSMRIGMPEYARTLRMETDNIHRRLGDNYSPELMNSLHLPQQVLQKMINQKLIQLESEAKGLVPSDAEVVRHIRANPAFQDSKGNFDKASFEAGLRGMGMSEKAFIDQQRQKIASDMLLETLFSRMPVPEKEVRTLLAAREEQRQLAVYMLKPSLVGNVPQPDEDQVVTYYRSHESAFTSPEYRTVSYVTLTQANVQANQQVSEDELRASYKERIDEFKKPERRTVEQLLFATEQKAQMAQSQLQHGTTFEEIAKQGDILNKNHIQLGKVERGNVMEGAGDMVFSLHIGEYSKPVQSPFGWHIFRVTAIDEPSIASFEEVRPQLQKELSQRGSDEALSKLSAKLEDTLAGGGTLSEAAAELKLNVQQAGPFDRSGKTPDGKAAVLPDLDKFSDMAFKTEEKTESALISSKGGYYLLRVDKVQPEQVRPLDSVRAQVVEAWQKEQREKKLGALSRDIAARFAQEGKRAGVIQEYNLKASSHPQIKHVARNSSEQPLPAELVADAFSLQPQQSTKAYPLANGDYVMALVENITPASTAENDPKLSAAQASIRRNLNSSVQAEVFEQYTRYLAKRYSVSIDQDALAQAAP